MEYVKELEEEILHLKGELEKSQRLIKDLSAPIIPSILPETILVPVVGNLFPERFEAMNAKILSAASIEDVTTVVIDFTAITSKEIEELDTFDYYVRSLKQSLQLMGVHSVFVGFGPNVTLKLLQSDLLQDDSFETYLSFKKALETLAAKRGYGFVKLTSAE
ncbi:hypothetical protein [Bacillus sp. 1P06AnD]|uniref:hypothetical protein n=1 Tax=Bacillus sp. 1P06AnD TaxID=3132208 RepID=UPI0039A290A5